MCVDYRFHVIASGEKNCYKNSQGHLKTAKKKMAPNFTTSIKFVDGDMLRLEGIIIYLWA